MNFIREEWVSIAVAVSVLPLSVLLGLWLRRRLLARVEGWTRDASPKVADVLVASLRRPIVAWTLLIGIVVASRIVTLPPRLAAFVDQGMVAILILSITIWLADVGVRLMVIGAGTKAGQPLAATGLIQNVVRLTVLTLGGLVLLNTLGISITPLVTTLGVGGLAVALGLQDTMANAFAGMFVTLARNVRVGDFVKLESGEEGTVEDIGWRAARLRMKPDYLVVIPNSRLAQSIVTNYDLPSRELEVIVKVGVHYQSDLERVEQVTCEVAREVVKTVSGGVPAFQPYIRFDAFGDSSINFHVTLRAKSFEDGELVKHEFIKRLAARYAREGIVIPYPVRAINLSQEGHSSFSETRLSESAKPERATRVSEKDECP